MEGLNKKKTCKYPVRVEEKKYPEDEREEAGENFFKRKQTGLRRKLTRKTRKEGRRGRHYRGETPLCHRKVSLILSVNEAERLVLLASRGERQTDATA